jgi:Flp pilus assembly protein TadD
LWVVVNRYPEEQWAPPALTQALMAGGRTRPLMQLFSVLSRRSPDDLEIKNNLAFTAMLLGAEEMNPYGLAQEVYAKDAKIPSYASTYAFSLYLQKKYPEALQVMQKLTAKDLENPSIAGYYGLILKATGNGEKAKAYLRLTANTKLLPEEQVLFQQAMGN